MNSEDRILYIREQMLKALADIGGYMLPEPVFLTQVNISVMPPMTRQEFSAQLSWLEGEGLVAGINPELGGPRKWKITDKGRAVL